MSIRHVAEAYLARLELSGRTEHHIKRCRRLLEHATADPVELSRFLLAEQKRLAPSTFHGRYRLLRGFYSWAEKTDLITPNPMEDIDIPLPPPEPVRVPEPGEVKAVVRACTTLRDRLLVTLLADTGLRASEAGGIDIEDIDVKASSILVLGKGKKRRLAYFSPASRYLLLRYIAERESGPLFLGKHGRRLGYNGVWNVVKKAAKRAGVGDLHPHSLRHAAISALLSNGVNQEAVMHQVGHSDVKTLMIYAAATRGERAREAVRTKGIFSK